MVLGTGRVSTVDGDFGRYQHTYDVHTPPSMHQISSVMNLFSVCFIVKVQEIVSSITVQLSEVDI